MTPSFDHPTPSDELSLHSLLWALRQQWMTVLACAAAGLLLAILALLVIQPRFQVQVYLDKPYDNEITELNIGRSSATGLAQYTNESVFAYFLQRLNTEEARQRFFQETYLPAQARAPESAAARQALYTHMLRNVLTVSPPSPRGRSLHSLQIIAPSGEESAVWAKSFLNQVAQDASHSLAQDAENSVALLISNTERELKEQLLTTAKVRQDRLAQLDEALKVAQAVGIRDPQMTAVQAPRQDGMASFIDGSRLYARGTKSLQAEIDVLKSREDDTPFVEGLRAAQAKLSQLREIEPQKRQFKIFHVDGELLAPEKPIFPKKSLVLSMGLVLGLLLGVVAAIWRSGVMRTLRDPLA